MTREMVLVFSNLYDDVWAAFPKNNRHKSRFQLRTIILPNDFVPETDTKYLCRVAETAMTTYTYDGQSYKVAYAMPKKMGDAIDIFHYQLDRSERRDSHLQGDGGRTMKAAFEKLIGDGKNFEKLVKEKKVENLS